MPNPFAEVAVDGQGKELRRLENYIDTQATPAERFQLQMQVEQRKFELESAREQEWRMRERSRRRQHSRINKSNLW